METERAYAYDEPSAKTATPTLAERVSGVESTQRETGKALIEHRERIEQLENAIKRLEREVGHA